MTSDFAHGGVSDSISVTDSWVCLHSPDNSVKLANSANNVGLTLDNRGLTYADGFFTTMGVVDGLILWQDYHHQRLISHGQALQLDIDDQAVLWSLQMHAQQLQQGMLKLIVTRAPQAIRGYGFTPSASGSACEVWLKSSALLIATAEHLRLPDGRAVLIQPTAPAICLSAQLACLPPPLAGLKSLNRLDNVLASGELQRIKTAQSNTGTKGGKGLGEGLLRDMTGSWVEGTMSNVFYQLSDAQFPNESQPLLNINSSDDANANYLLNGQWFTPPMTQSGVAGVMRQVIIDALSKAEHPVQMRALNDEDLPNMSQMFFCNALRGVMPVSELSLPVGDSVCFSI
jgi:4-amino-4-deoxychorismate lyase